MENIYAILFDIIEQVCLNYKNNEQFTKIQIILSNIFDTIRKAGSINIIAMNMTLIDLVAKLLLSDDIKGIFGNIIFYITISR